MKLTAYHGFSIKYKVIMSVNKYRAIFKNIIYFQQALL